MTHHIQGLQMQLNNLRQDLNNIMQMASQLSQQEQNNAMELQRLRQLETNATQQLQRIQQICSSLSNSLNQISGMAQQYGGGMYGAGAQQQFGTTFAAQQPFTQPYQAPAGTTGFGTYNVPTYGTGAYAQNLGQYSAVQPEYRSPAAAQAFGQTFGAQNIGQFGAYAAQPQWSAQAFSANPLAGQSFGQWSALQPQYRATGNVGTMGAAGSMGLMNPGNYSAVQGYLSPNIAGQI